MFNFVTLRWLWPAL